MMMRTIRQVVGRWQWIAAAGMLVFSLPMAAFATVQDIRVVGVGVDSSSLQAEKNALEYAKKRAVFLAVRKLGVKNASKVAAKFTPEQHQQIVRGANVVQTRREGEITYLEVNVTLVDEALYHALKLPNDYGKAVTAPLDVRGVLVLPVLVGKDRAYVWEKENELREPLADELRRQSQGSVLLAGGDLEDLRLIDYQNALTVDPDELKPMFERYGAEEIIIAILTLSQPGTSDASSMLLRRLTPGNVRNELIEIPVENEAETLKQRMAKAAASIASAVTQIATSTAEREEAMRQKAKKIAVRFSYTTPKELARMQTAVRTSPEVLSLDLPRIALSQVGGTIFIKGDAEKLREALVMQGIFVTPISDGWRLSVR